MCAIPVCAIVQPEKSDRLQIRSDNDLRITDSGRKESGRKKIGPESAALVLIVLSPEEEIGRYAGKDK